MEPVRRLKILLALLFLGGAASGQDPGAVVLRWRFTKGEMFRYETYVSISARVAQKGFAMDSGTGMAFEILEVAGDGTADLRVTFDRATAVLVEETLISYDSERDARPPKNEKIQFVAGMLGRPFRIKIAPSGTILKMEDVEAVVKAANETMDEDLRDPDFDAELHGELLKASVQEVFPPLPQGPVRPSDVWKGERQTPSTGFKEAGIHHINSMFLESLAQGKEALLWGTHRETMKATDNRGDLNQTGRQTARWDVERGRLLQAKSETRAAGTLLGHPAQWLETRDIRRMPAFDRASHRRVWELIRKLGPKVDSEVFNELWRMGAVAWLPLRTMAGQYPAGSLWSALPDILLAGAPEERYADRGPTRRRLLLEQRGGGEEIELAALTGLLWLIRHQNEDGSWGAFEGRPSCGRMRPDLFVGACEMGEQGAETAVAQTGLALLAFHGMGFSWRASEEYEGHRVGALVSGALSFLDRCQDAGGAYHPTSVLSHAIATAAVLDTPAGFQTLDWNAISALRALRALLRLRTSGAGWPKELGGAPDGLTTSWALLALWRAREAGLEVSAEAVAEAAGWLNRATSASALLARQLKPGGAVEGGKDLLSREPGADVMEEKFAALALLRSSEVSAEGWKSWQERHLKPRLRARASEPGTCAHGSWPASPGAPSRVASTALHCLLLQSYYRYPVPATAGPK